MNRFAGSLMAAALPLAAFGFSPGVVMAQGYSGSWPLNVALPPQFGHTACLTLVDNGTGGKRGLRFGVRPDVRRRNENRNTPGGQPSPRGDL